MAAKKNGKKVAKTKAGGLPAVLAGRMQSDAGRGHATRAEDLAIPYIGLIQDLSPQVKAREAKYIDGAEVGDLFNSVTNELWEGEEGLLVVPCAFESKYVEWIPRSKGGGFVQSFDTDSDIMNQTERVETDNGYSDKLPNGNEILLTAYHYVVIVSPDGKLSQAMIAMAKTSLKKSRAWMTQINNQQVEGSDGDMFNPPSFAYTYRITSGEESNAMNSWFNFTIEVSGMVESENLYDAAEKFAASIDKGDVNRSYGGPDGEAKEKTESAI
jgi:hypothetical protein